LRARIGANARRSAAEHRQKTAELTADVGNVAPGVGRSEAILDRWAAAPSPPSRPWARNGGPTAYRDDRL